MFASQRPQVEDPIGFQDRLAVVFDDQHGIAQVTQPFQGTQQTGVIAWVQTNRRLIQHVQHTHQARANLGRQADTLRFAAGKREAAERCKVR